LSRYLRKSMVLKGNDEVVDRDAVKALHQLYMIFKLNCFSLNPLSMIHPLLLRRV